MSVNPARKYVLKLDKKFIWLVKLESNFNWTWNYKTIDQSIKEEQKYLPDFTYNRDGNDLVDIHWMEKISLHIYLYILFIDFKSEERIEKNGSE